MSGGEKTEEIISSAYHRLEMIQVELAKEHPDMEFVLDQLACAKIDLEELTP